MGFLLLTTSANPLQTIGTTVILRCASSWSLPTRTSRRTALFAPWKR